MFPRYQHTYQNLDESDSFQTLDSSEESTEIIRGRNILRASLLLFSVAVIAVVAFGSKSPFGSKSQENQGHVLLFEADKPKIKNDLSEIKFDSRLSPLFVSRYTSEKDIFHTFFSKYGLVGNRRMNSEMYTAPTIEKKAPMLNAESKTWAYATMYSGTECDGVVQTVGGIAVGECNAVPGYGGADSNAFLLDCSDGGDIVMNSYTSADCSSESLLSSSMLAQTNTCYDYASSMFGNPTTTDFSETTSTSTSVTFQCSPVTEMPDMSSYDIQKIYISSDESASSVCEKSPSTDLDGSIFEAIPIGLCIPQSMDGSIFSLMFTADDSTGQPYLNYYIKTLICDTNSVPQQLTMDCVNQQWGDTVNVYAKWQYRA